MKPPKRNRKSTEKKDQALLIDYDAVADAFEAARPYKKQMMYQQPAMQQQMAQQQMYYSDPPQIVYDQTPVAIPPMMFMQQAEPAMLEEMVVPMLETRAADEGGVEAEAEAESEAEAEAEAELGLGVEEQKEEVTSKVTSEKKFD